MQSWHIQLKLLGCFDCAEWAVAEETGERIVDADWVDEQDREEIQ